MSTFSELKARASLIMNETSQGANTAERVGSLFYDYVSALETLSESSYDDSSLIERINNVKEDVDNLIDRERSSIEGMINEILSGYNFTPEWQAGWDEELQRYLISTGFLGEDGVTKGWAYLELKYNELKGTVDALEVLIDPETGAISMETLQAMIDASIENSQAIVNLSARYALLDDTETLLRWLSSQFRIAASNNESVAEMFAAAQDLSSLRESYSGLASKVENIEGNYVSSANLTTSVTDIMVFV